MVLLYVERLPRLTEHPNTQSCHNHEISKQKHQQPEGNKYLSLSHLGKNLKDKSENYPFLINLGLQDLWSKLYFCGYKIRFVPSKVTCRLLQQRSDKSLFRFAKEDVLKENELLIRILVPNDAVSTDNG